MSTIEITAENFQERVEAEGILVLDVWAPWCGPCRAFAPIFEAVAGKNPDVTFAKLDSQAQPTLAQALHIQAIPTLMVFRDGILVFRESGLLPEKALTQLVDEVRKLDMEAIRREVSEAEQAQASA